MQLNWRKAVVADAPALAAVHAAAMRNGAWDADFIARLLRQDAVFGLVVGTPITSFILLQLTPPQAEILTLAVMPASQRQGVARLLLQAAEEQAVMKGCAAMMLDVAANNSAACALYEKSGYRLVHTRAGYYQQGTAKVDALVMGRVLR